MLWIKSLHIIAMVTWFAALFYLPRLFVYHAQAEDRISQERFCVMERKLFFGIMTPGAILTMAAGVWLLFLQGFDWFFASTWLHWKLGLVALLIVYHCYLGVLCTRFANNANRHGHVFYRWLNEMPVFVLAAVVILAIVKP